MTCQPLHRDGLAQLRKALCIFSCALLLPPRLLGQNATGDSTAHRESDPQKSWPSQEPMRPPDTTGVNIPRLSLVCGLTLGAMTAIQIYQANGWWKDNRRSFHFQEDLVYGRGIDKLGHLYGGSAVTFVFSRSLRWANVSEESSLWWGAGSSLLFQGYLEVMDGFSTWGFDRADFAADVAGAFYPVAQYYVPLLRSFNFKMSYHPSPMINQPGGVGFQGQKHLMFDDYEGQTIWLSLSVNNLLPRSLEPMWPDWLSLAVGYGVRDVMQSNPYGIVLIGLDVDMTELVPRNTAFLRTLGETLNFIKFPAPAIRISPNVIWYGIYF